MISCITEQHLRKLIIHYKLELPRIPFVIGVNNDTQKPLGCITITFKVNRLTVN